MTVEVGSRIAYFDEDRCEVEAIVEKIDVPTQRLLVSWGDGRQREWIEANAVYYVKGESVIVYTDDDVVTAKIRRIDTDGDVITTRGRWYRRRLAKVDAT